MAERLKVYNKPSLDTVSHIMRQNVTSSKYAKVCSLLKEVITYDNEELYAAGDEAFDELISICGSDDEMALDLLDSAFVYKTVDPSKKGKPIRVQTESLRNQLKKEKQDALIEQKIINNIWLSEAHYELIRTHIIYKRSCGIVSNLMLKVNSSKKTLSSYWESNADGTKYVSNYREYSEVKSAHVILQYNLRKAQNRCKRLKTHIKEWERKLQKEGI